MRTSKRRGKGASQVGARVCRPAIRPNGCRPCQDPRVDASLAWTLVGVAVSVLGLGVTFVLSQPDRPKVAVEVANAFHVWGDDVGEWSVSVEAVNTGGTATTIAGWGLHFPTVATSYRYGPRGVRLCCLTGSIRTQMPSSSCRRTIFFESVRPVVSTDLA